jgi:hypothetical protein
MNGRFAFSVHHVLILALTLLKHPPKTTPSLLDRAPICNSFCMKYVKSDGNVYNTDTLGYALTTHTFTSLLMLHTLELPASTLLK